MSFRPNPPSFQQLSMFDGYRMLSDKKQRMLKDSWATTFRDEIFANIDEEPYRKLFDEEGAASCPNYPINTLVAASIIKKMFGLSEEELFESINLDLRYSYALNLDSLSEDVFSLRTYERLISKVVAHHKETGEDLIQQTWDSLTDQIAKVMGIDKTNRRMDSFMVQMSAKDMSRRELIYKAIKGFVSYLFLIGDTEGISYMGHYTQDGDQNNVLYRCPAEHRDGRDHALLKDASVLIEKCGGSYADEKAYKVFSRIINEQTILENGTRRFRNKEDGGFGSNIAQSTTDMDATFRSKAGKGHKGYVANVEESVGDNGSIITDYDFRPNNVSDQEMLSDRIERSDVQEQKTVIVADGAYDNDEIREAAARKNIDIITTDMTGRKVPVELGAFNISDDGKVINTCPAGHAPISNQYDEKTGQCHATFDAACCERCPYSSACKPKGKGKTRKVTISQKKVQRAKRQAELSGEERTKYSHFRNGVETIPSYFRSSLGVDDMKAFGLSRNRIHFGLDAIAFNVIKLIRFRQRQRTKCALT